MIWEIILVILGIAVIAAGYIIPSSKDNNKGQTPEGFSREKLRAMADEEIEAARGRITDIVDETITYAMEKTERSMDRISNEKMMAVEEYSDTVLEQINKSHEEVVFLYDMLNDKHENLKGAVAEATKAASEVKATIKEVEETKADVIPTPEETGRTKKDNAFKPVPIIKISDAPIRSDEEDLDEDEYDEALLEEEWDDIDAEDVDDDDDEIEGPVISFDSRSPGSRNSNERILELHKSGKSNMAIARELGLGVGEVKLVIDLFKGL